MKLLVGLGNPGDKYRGTRHNVGFSAMSYVANHYQFPDFKKHAKYKALITEGIIAGEKVILLKPQTFMNLSGEAVLPLLSFYKLKPEDVVIVYDELDVDCGEIRLKKTGGAAGHNGIKSVINAIGPDFARFRIGIKPIKPFPGDMADYVLGKLSVDEKDLILPVIEKLPSILELFITDGLEASMNQFH